jgi:hypothetical protein
MADNPLKLEGLIAKLASSNCLLGDRLSEIGAKFNPNVVLAHKKRLGF